MPFNADRLMSAMGRYLPTKSRARIVKCSLAASPPQQQKLISVRTKQLGGRFEQDAVEYGTIVIHKVDQTGLSDEPAKLDQLAGALAALHHPGSAITPGAPKLRLVARDPRATKAFCGFQ